MTIFKSKEERDEKKIERINKKIEKLGLKELDIAEKNQAESILNYLSDCGQCELTICEEDDVPTTLAKAQIEQNWILLKKLDNIEKELKKVNNK